MKRESVQEEIRAAKQRWPIGNQKLKELRQLINRHRLSVAQGDVLLLGSNWYVTHSGLLRCARQRRCAGIKTRLEANLSDPMSSRWVFKATVYLGGNSKAFTGYGDADPSNVSALVRGAEMRVAETRAVNRALRKAYGIGLCSVEELGAISSASSAPQAAAPHASCPSNGHNGNAPRLRDQLCLVIRQFKLDANLVKSYAADFCGTEVISEASRESLEAFVAHLKKSAEENRDALLCKLNSYSVRAGVDS